MRSSRTSSRMGSPVEQPSTSASTRPIQPPTFRTTTTSWSRSSRGCSRFQSRRRPTCRQRTAPLDTPALTLGGTGIPALVVAGTPPSAAGMYAAFCHPSRATRGEPSCSEAGVQGGPTKRPALGAIAAQGALWEPSRATCTRDQPRGADPAPPLESRSPRLLDGAPLSYDPPHGRHGRRRTNGSLPPHARALGRHPVAPADDRARFYARCCR